VACVRRCDWKEPPRPRRKKAAISPRPGHVFALTLLHYKELLPFAPMACRGGIWYQGASNDRAGFIYAKTFKTMIDAIASIIGQPLT
jgi:hypothetical protein